MARKPKVEVESPFPQLKVIQLKTSGHANTSSKFSGSEEISGGFHARGHVRFQEE